MGATKPGDQSASAQTRTGVTMSDRACSHLSGRCTLCGASFPVREYLSGLFLYVTPALMRKGDVLGPGETVIAAGENWITFRTPAGDYHERTIPARTLVHVRRLEA